jgi:cytochrome P450|nr:cytochrome P450 [uncultured bacterium]
MRTTGERVPSLLTLLAGGGGSPYPLYRELLRDGPLHWDEWMRSWLVLGHDEIAELARDDRLSGARIDGFYDQLPMHAKAAVGPLKTALSNMMLFNEPPRHTRLRQLVRPGLTPGFTRRMRPVIQRLVVELLDDVVGRGEFDVIHDFSEPLTRGVIARLAGVPPHGAHLLEDWQGLLHEFFTQSRAEIPRITALRRVFDEGTAARRAGTGEDMFSQVISGQLAKGDYTDDEIFANFLLLIDAGQATTTHLIGNAVLALVEHPEQARLLRDEPELAANAAHEFMRYDSSVQFTTRVALADIDIAGTRIAAGQSVALVIGSGNRDPRHYEHPDRLDVTRRAHDHLSFGSGIHFCLGAALALAEIELAIAELLRRVDDLRLVHPEPRWLESVNFRFLKALPVRFRAASGQEG